MELIEVFLKNNIKKEFNKGWKLKIKKNKERRGPDSDPKMRYFKIPLYRIFVRKVRDFSGQMTRVSGVIRSKIGVLRFH